MDTIHYLRWLHKEQPTAVLDQVSTHRPTFGTQLLNQLRLFPGLSALSPSLFPSISCCSLPHACVYLYRFHPDIPSHPKSRRDTA